MRNRNFEDISADVYRHLDAMDRQRAEFHRWLMVGIFSALIGIAALGATMAYGKVMQLEARYAAQARV
ncbi:MAG: hypothetical protein U5K75_08950 [Ahrensia sp.]|nr:hypothetical protein [Ahrensia sp.]